MPQQSLCSPRDEAPGWQGLQSSPPGGPCQGLPPGASIQVHARGSATRGLGCRAHFPQPYFVVAVTPRAPPAGAAGPALAPPPSPLQEDGQDHCPFPSPTPPRARGAGPTERSWSKKQLTWRKTLDKPQLRGTLQTPWPAHPERAKPRDVAPARRRREGRTSCGSWDRRGRWVTTREAWIKAQLQLTALRRQASHRVHTVSRAGGEGELCPRCSVFPQT